KGWSAVRSARRDYLSRMNWVNHRRAIAPLLAYLLALLRQILMPQAYVRRRSQHEMPPCWDLLDFPSGRPGGAAGAAAQRGQRRGSARR
ncbi:hypothetical protein ACFQ9B_45145, partial [Streptomyces sp. NPDC056549]